MIFAEVTFGGTMYRIADDDYPFVHQWRGRIYSIASIKIATKYKHGGYAGPVFSDFSVFSDAFGDVPTPDFAELKLYHSETNEDDKVMFFDGTMRMADLDEGFTKYTLHRVENATTVPTGTVFNATLAAVMATLCGPNYLNLTLDISRARIPSPAVLETTTSDQLTIDLASEMAASFCHGFKIIGGTLYLIDLLYQPDYERLTFYNGEEIRYRKTPPYSLAKCGDYTVAGSDATGSELSVSKIFHTTEANILAAMTDILALAEQPTIEIDAPVRQNPLEIFGLYEHADDTKHFPIDSTMIVTDIIYNHDESKLQVSGPGTMTI